MTMTNKEAIKAYLAVAKETGQLPTGPQLRNQGVTPAFIRHHYGSLDGLHDHMAEEFRPQLENRILNEEAYTLSPKEVQSCLDAYPNLFITSAVAGAKPCKKFLAAARSWCEENDGLLVILPVKDTGKAGRVQYPLNHAFKDEVILFGEYKLTEALTLSGIKVLSRQLNPSTGLERIVAKEGSMVVGGTKQYQKPVAHSHTEEYPRVLLVTGACTEPNYDKASVLRERTGYLADKDHMIGATIIRKHSDGVFFTPYNVRYDGKSGFVDNCYYYSHNKKPSPERPLFFSPGDLHFGEEDPELFEKWVTFCKEYRPQYLYLHDIFNGTSPIVNHHEGYKPTYAAKSKEIFSCLSEELVYGLDRLNQICPHVDKAYVVDSNHNDWITRFVSKGDFTKVTDKDDIELLGYLFSKSCEDGALLEYAYKFVSEKYNVPYPSNLHFPEPEEDISVNKQLVIHGHRGLNGARGSVKGHSKTYSNGVQGHDHQLIQEQGWYSCGHSTLGDQDYKRGSLSTWQKGGVIGYNRNNSLHLFPLIDGKLPHEL